MKTNNFLETLICYDQIDKELETKLRELGADFVSTEPWGNYVVVDGNLITGQNPQSSDSFSKAILEVLTNC